MVPSHSRKHLHSEPSGLEVQRFSPWFQSRPAEHESKPSFYGVFNNARTPANHHFKHKRFPFRKCCLHNNQVIGMTSCEQTQTSPCTLKTRATFSPEERKGYSTEKSAGSNLLTMVLRNKTALTLIITVRLLVGHYSLTQLGSVLLGIGITSSLQNLNINFIGKSVQYRLPH